MASYFDSSLLLAGVLGQIDRAELSDLWDREAVRVASVLVEVECLISLRRIAAAKGRGAGPRWLAERAAVLQPFLDDLTVKYVDEDVLAVIRDEPRLADCRALDAVHLATALNLQPHVGAPLRICTLDRRMRAVAASLGFAVAPSA